MSQFFLPIILLLGLTIWGKAVNPEVVPERPSYNAHIRPVLLNKCFGCHGASLSEGAEIHLNSREEAIANRAIVPGDPTASNMIKRAILPREDDLAMPPESGHKAPLTEIELATLKRWIEQGAEYEPHWSFQAVDRPIPPEPNSENKDWVRNPIDQFALRKMVEHGLSPNPKDGDPRRLIRRLAFDLTGLPPSTEQVERFASDPSEENYQGIINELFSSPRYGEHWARHWLDAVRYADTHGIHIDNYRSIWPYRDWVISAYNENMPFDQFTIEQMAGDMLPSPTNGQRIATGYNRCLPTSSEAGQINEEWAVIYANDRVATTFGIWQGLTAGCAACHDHKYDPLSQKEYYQLTAYFRNNTMPIDDGDVEDTPPAIPYPSAEQEKKTQELTAKYKALSNEFSKNGKAVEGDFAPWLASALRKNPAPSAHGLQLSTRLEKATKRADDLFGSVAVVDGKHPYQEKIPSELGEASEAGFTFGATFRSAKKSVTGHLFGNSNPAKNFEGFEVFATGRRARVQIRTAKHGSFVGFTNENLTNTRWYHLSVTVDPQAKAEKQVQLYLNGKAVPWQRTEGNLLPGAGLVSQPVIAFGPRATDNPDHLGAPNKGEFRFRDSFFYNRVLEPKEVADLYEHSYLRSVTSIPEKKWARKLREMAFDSFYRDEHPELAELKSQTETARKALQQHRKSIPVTLVMEEKKDSKPIAHVLDRGDYTQRKEKVDAGVPAFLPPLPEGAPNNRLGLAKWLVDPANPLTARTTVNRIWSYLFGRGIVPTVGDLGLSGDNPSHPELLDWLASEFVESGWDQQHLLRLIVSSSAYRQSQKASSAKFSADLENVWLSRGPRYRLDGEQIRDLALEASGLLSQKIGGPPVKPYQPEGVWKEVAMLSSNTKVYTPGTGDDLYRRSLYTFYKRTAGPSSMMIFDAPARDTLCVARERTNTPLQAFVTLNDPQFVEAARIAGEKAARNEGDFAKKALDLGRRFLSRDFRPEEVIQLQETYSFALKEFETQPEQATALLTVGEAASSSEVPAPELAAWTMVASQVLNLDETLTK